MSESGKAIPAASVEQLQRYDWAGWIDWVGFAPLDLKTVPSKPGAYVLSTTRPINRAIGTDPMGILDIGETGKGQATLQGRLTDMRRCMMRRGDEGHMGRVAVRLLQVRAALPARNAPHTVDTDRVEGGRRELRRAGHAGLPSPSRLTASAELQGELAALQGDRMEGLRRSRLLRWL